MPISRTILCPVDFSEDSRLALAWACTLVADDGHLIVLNAVEPLLAEAARIRLGIDLTTAETEPALRRFVEAACAGSTPPRCDVALRVRAGQPSEVILETAAAVRADLIVMGTHGLGGLRKWILGSTTERVLRRTQIPVLATPSDRAEPPNHMRAAPTSEVRLVLAAVDFSDGSSRALDCAAVLASQFSATLLLLHVVEPISIPPLWSAALADADEERVASARTRLHQLVERISFPVRCEATVTLGCAVVSIAATADSRHADLIVMGLAGSGPWFGARPGSIAYGVLSLASTAVLIVPPQSPTSASDREAL